MNNPDSTEWRRKAFDFAQDVTKQLITLATGIVALSITFVKDFANGAPKGARILLATSWFFYLLSTIAGILTLMALTGTLRTSDQPDIMGNNARRPAIGQVLAFFVGMLLSIIAGVWAL
ncbi:hypothetical protein OHA10_23095 [Kribbella sp. NBC_00662]|uniref:hypothetical protein n=1 Tax=Kribbella sp. NBC_00662 TaxID=2975969 RepID=UPI003253A246